MLQIDRTKILKKRHSSSSSSDATGRFASPQHILPINEPKSTLNLNKIPATAPIKILDKGSLRSRAVSEDANASSYNSSVGASVQFYTSTIASSSMSDLDDWPDEPVGDWLNEEIEETARSDSSEEKSVVLYDESISKLSAEQQALRDMLIHVEDLRFRSLPEHTQRGILNSIILRECRPHDIIIQEGESSNEFYFVLGPHDAQVEVFRTSKGEEKLLTRLGVGQYFGQKYFITNRPVLRNASVRAISTVQLGVVTPSYFAEWSHFRTFLLMKAVPLIRTLPQSEQLEMYSLLQHQEFQDGDYIVRQGDTGDKFYIITEGAADVVEELWVGTMRRKEVLTRLYEGHFFGEMALIYDEPRVASVIAVGKTSCLYLSKAAFREALTDKQFHIMMQDISYQRVITREKREAAKLTMSSLSLSHEPSTSSTIYSSDVMSTEDSFLSRTNTLHSTASLRDDSSVTTTNILVRKRLSTGDRFVNKFLVIRELGRGSFGDVYLCRNEENNELYAMKMINRSNHRWNLKEVDEVKTEIAIMKKLQHENVVNLLEVIDDPSSKQVYLIQEYMQGGPVLPNTEMTDPIATEQARSYFRDMIKGVMYLHSQGIVHRDLKPQNMLKTADDQVKIADFGAAVFVGSGNQVLARGGTPAFMAPELFKVGLVDEHKDAANSPKADVWGLGATLYNMVIGHPPWMAANEIELAQMVQHFELTFPEVDVISLDPHLKNLLKQMLEKDPKQRISMNEIVWHDWVTLEGSHPLYEDDFLHEFSASVSFIDMPRYQSVHVSASDVASAFSPCTPISLVMREKLKAARNSAEKRSSFEAVDLDIDEDCTAELVDASEVEEDFIYKVSNTTQEESPQWRSPRPRSQRLSGRFFPTQNESVMHSSTSPTTLESTSEADKSSKQLSPPGESFAEPRKSLSRKKEFVLVPTETVVTPSGNVVTGFTLSHPKGAVASSLKLTEKSISRVVDNSDDSGSSKDSSDEEPFQTKSSHESDRRLPSLHSLFPLLKDHTSSHSLGTQDSNGEKTKIYGKMYRKQRKTPRSESEGSEDESDVDYISDLDENSSKLTLSSSVTANDESKKEKKKKSAKQDDDSSIVSYTFEEDDIVTLDDAALDGMLNSLCEGGREKTADTATSPIKLDKRSRDAMFMVKTWAGQSNLRMGVRYGVAESKNTRITMEDRTIAKPSIEEDVRRYIERSASGSLPGIADPTYLERGRAEDFAFFGIYDGHEGNYVSQYLQNNLHVLFRAKLIEHGGHESAAVTSLMEACAAADREVLFDDAMRLKAQMERRERDIDGAQTPMNSFSSAHSGDNTNNTKFAGSTAVVAVLMGGIPYVTPDGPTPRSSINSQTTHRGSMNNSSMSSMSSYIHPSSPDICEGRGSGLRINTDVASVVSTSNSVSTPGGSMTGVSGISTNTPTTPQNGTASSMPVKMYIANVGDSRAVLSDNGNAVQLTLDHSPQNVKEKDRIEAAGGWVQNGRVNTVLGVSRSFGDIMYKTFDPLKAAPANEDEEGGIWCPQSQVISKPEIVEMTVQPTHEFLILASDGLWAICSSSEAVNFVRRRLAEHGDAQRAAREVVNMVVQQGGSDNISVLVICLNQIGRGQSGYRELRSLRYLMNSSSSSSVSSLGFAEEHGSRDSGIYQMSYHNLNSFRRPRARSGSLKGPGVGGTM